MAKTITLAVLVKKNEKILNEFRKYRIEHGKQVRKKGIFSSLFN